MAKRIIVQIWLELNICCVKFGECFKQSVRVKRSCALRKIMWVWLCWRCHFVVGIVAKYHLTLLWRYERKALVRLYKRQQTIYPVMKPDEHVGQLSHILPSNMNPNLLSIEVKDFRSFTLNPSQVKSVLKLLKISF